MRFRVLLFIASALGSVACKVPTDVHVSQTIVVGDTASRPYADTTPKYSVLAIAQPNLELGTFSQATNSVVFCAPLDVTHLFYEPATSSPFVKIAGWNLSRLGSQGSCKAGRQEWIAGVAINSDEYLTSATVYLVFKLEKEGVPVFVPSFKVEVRN